MLHKKNWGCKITLNNMKGFKDFSVNKKNGWAMKFFIAAVALFLFIFILNFFSSGIKNTFFVLTLPAQKNLWTAGELSSGFFSSFAKAGTLSNENQNLQNQNQKLQAEIASLQSIISGNQAQTNVSLACQNNGFKLLMAGVVGLDDQDMLSINKGSADGVLQGMPVISQQGALYGKVAKVYKSYSEVMLISNKNSVISVKVQQQNIPAGVQALIAPNATAPAAPKEIGGVVKGTGKMGMFLDLVPIDDILNQGDILVTSALEGNFPKDLLVGTIGKITKNDQDPHQTSQVTPFLSSSVDNLFVITNYKR